MNTLSLAPPKLPGINTHDTWHDFSVRVSSDPARVIWCTIALAVVAGIVWTINKGLAIVSGIGGFYVMWYIYNFFSARPNEQLFVGVGSPKSEWALWYTGGWSVLAMIVALAAGIGIFMGLKKTHGRRHHLPGRIMAGLGTWGGIMLIYTLVIVEFGAGPPLGRLISAIGNAIVAGFDKL